MIGHGTLDNNQTSKLNNIDTEDQDLKSAKKAEQIRRRMEEEELVKRARAAAAKLQQENRLSGSYSGKPASQTTAETESLAADPLDRTTEDEAGVSTEAPAENWITYVRSDEKQDPAPAEKNAKKPARIERKKRPRPADKGPMTGKELVLSLAGGLLLIIALSSLITYLALLMQSAPADGVTTLAQPFNVLFLNFIPIALTMLVLSLLFWNVWVGGGLTALLWLAMALANTLKIQARDEALAFQDIFLIKEALGATQHYSLRVPILLIFLSANLVLLLLFLGRVLRKRRRPKHVWALRLIGTVLAAALTVAVVVNPLASKDRFESFKVENEFYVTGLYNQLGFPYCFTYYLTKNNAIRPENYNENDAKAFEEEPTYGQGKDVHVIFVMNESFTDLSDNEIFDYPASEDPLKNFHALSKSDHAYSGHIVVHWFGGGTANTEYDVTTGMQTEMLDSTSASAFRYVKNDTGSIFRVFNGDGYRTMFMHPGDAWFYNRENVYPRLGAQDVLFTEDMKGLEYKGDWITDESLSEYIFKEYEATVEKKQNLFAFVTTIQNHMSYDYGKYGDGYVFKKVYTDKEVSYDNRAYLPVYMEGIYDADESLKQMTDYFEKQEEPVVLVFFGDHYPALGPDREVYKELDLPMADETGNSSEDPFCAYETPYIVWANDAAAEELDFETAVKKLDLPEDGIISANYLGASVLELTGRGKEDSFFNFLNEMRRELPVVSGGRYKDAQGNVITKLSPSQQELVDKLRNWSYYRLTSTFHAAKSLIIDSGSEG